MNDRARNQITNTRPASARPIRPCSLHAVWAEVQMVVEKAPRT